VSGLRFSVVVFFHLTNRIQDSDLSDHLSIGLK